MTVHSGSGLLPSYKLIPVTFDEAQIVNVQVDHLPSDWRAFPGPYELRRIGDDWLEKRSSLVLRVPSAIVPIECNYLLNPEHLEFSTVAIGDPESFGLDLRLL